MGHIALGFAILLLLTFVPFLVLRAYARVVERKPLADMEKAGRLRRAFWLSIAGVVLALLIVGLSSGLWEALRSATLGSRWSLIIFVAVVMLMGIVGSVSSYLGVHPAYTRVQRLNMTPQRAAYRILAGLAVGTLPIALSLVAISILPETFSVEMFVLLLWFLFLGSALLLVAPLMWRTRRVTAADPHLRRHVLELCRSRGLSVRDVKVFEGRSERLVGIGVSSVIPGLRSMMISDHLLFHLDDVELDAVVVQGIELSRRTTSFTLVYLSLISVVVALWALIGASATNQLFWVFVILGLGAALFRSAWIRSGVRAADDDAARTVGLDAAISTLEKLERIQADAGMGAGRSPLVRDLSSRLERLRSQRFPWSRR
jgi:hypothetical protein